MCVALLFVAFTAKAESIFSNLNTTNALNGYSFGAHTSYAQKFSSGSGGSITNISLNLFNNTPNPFSGGLTVGIFADTGSGPSASSLFDYFTGDETDLGTLGGAPISLAGNIVGADTPLSSGTFYWLVVQRDNPSTNGASLSWGAGDSFQGGAGLTYQTVDFGANWTEIPSFSEGFGAEIFAEAVPAPSTYALLMLGAAGLGAHALRRRRE
jgi:hypothetical protein